MKTRNLSADLPFPQDIMIEILHRLPLKTLLSCKRVSKLWKDLIHDPIFYRRHTTTRTAFILRRDATLEVTLSALFLSHVDEDLEMHRIPIDRADFYSRGAQLLNSGKPNETMVCLVSVDGIFFFYNLFTGAAFVVEGAPMRQHSSSWICYGYGYDSHADDHKIFVACHNDYANKEKYSGVQNAENSLFWVYSFSNKVWERFDGFSNCASYDMIRHQSTGYSFNGVLHWVFCRNYGQFEKVIVTYDLHTSRFGEMLVPKNAPISEHIHGWSGKVSQLNGLLCYSYSMWNYAGDLWHVVWVMNEYGVEDSWQKLVSIDCHSLDSEIPIRPDGSAYAWNSVAIHESEEGRIAVLVVSHDSGKMFWYGLKQGKIRVINEDRLLKERIETKP